MDVVGRSISSSSELMDQYKGRRLTSSNKYVDFV